MTWERRSRRASARLASALLAASVLIVSCSSSTPASDPTDGSSDAPLPPLQLPVAVHDGYEWRQLPIGAGGFVTGIVTSVGPDATLYARTDVGGAYRWNRSTSTWTQLISAISVPEPSADGTDFTVESIAVAPTNGQRVYAAVGSDYNPGPDGIFVGSGRVLISSDGGNTWRAAEPRWFISGNQRFRTGSERLAVDPNDPDHVLFGSGREGLWQSFDAGVSWQQIASDMVPFGQFADPGSDQYGVGTVAFVGTHLVAGVANVGVFASDDDGKHWQLVHGIDTEQYPSGAADVQGELWVSIDRAGEGDGVVGVYDFDSSTWRELPMPVAGPFFTFAVDPRDPSHIVLADYAIRDGHFWTSTDGGATWATHDIAISSPTIPWLQETDLDEFMSTGRLLFDPADGSLWFAEGMATWRTTAPDDDEVTWVAFADGIEETVTTTLIVPPGGTPVGGVADRQGFRWEDLTRPPTHTLIDRTFVGRTSVDYSGGSPNVLVWVGAEYHVYYDDSRRARGAISTDGGRTWRQFDGLDREMFGGEVAVSATDPNVVVWVPTHFANTSEYLTKPAGVWSTSDGGKDWQHLDTVGGTDAFHRLVWWFGRRALAADRVNGSFYLMSDDEQFFVSTDGGQQWQKAAFSPPCRQTGECHVFGQVQAQPEVAQRVWASAGTEGFYRSDDAGTTAWQRIPGIDDARAFGFGAPLTAGGPTTVFLYGRANGQPDLGLWRTIDDGATWQRVARYPAGLHAGVTSVTGDPDVPGRVFVGFSGVGYVRGDLPGSG